MKHVKELLKKYIEADNQILEERDAFVTYVELIDELQEAIEQDEKENGWIPVSERLPEGDTTVLVSCKTRRGTTFVRTGYCIDGSWHLNCEGVTAWQPLPKPYKED